MMQTVDRAAGGGMMNDRRALFKAAMEGPANAKRIRAECSKNCKDAGQYDEEFTRAEVAKCEDRCVHMAIPGPICIAGLAASAGVCGVSVGLLIACVEQNQPDMQEILTCINLAIAPGWVCKVTIS